MTQAHHLRHWIDGGSTGAANLVSLCGFHHRRHHDGDYDIDGTATGLRFVDRRGRTIGAPPAPPPPMSSIGHLRAVTQLVDAASPTAEDHGASFSLGYAVEVIAAASAFRRQSRERAP